MSGVNIPRQVPLRDPRSFSFYNVLKAETSWGRDFIDFLVQLTEQIQVMNRQVRDALTSNRTSGTMVIDDGTTRMTVLVNHGNIQSVATAASSGATLSWTAA